MKDLNKANAISCFIKESLLIIFFTYLIIILTRKWYSKKGSLGGLPILVCLFIIVDSVFEIVHTALVLSDNGYYKYYIA